MQRVVCTLPSKKRIEIEYGTRVGDLLQREEEFREPPHPILAAKVNNELVSLSFKIEINSIIETVSLDSEAGMRIYRNSLSFLLSRAVSELYPKRKLIIGHSLGHGYYFYFDRENEVSQGDLDALKARMEELVEADEPIQRRVISYAEALDYFKKTGHHSRVELLRYRNEPKIPLYVSGDHREIGYQPLVPSTGYLKLFELRSYSPGFLLRYPSSSAPDKVAEFSDNPVLFSVFMEYKAWGKILNVNSVGKLNRLVESKKVGDFIRVAEALHNKKIASIADKIAERRGTVKSVMIAGPSSSGKTTFTKKLGIQLKVLGFNPVIISLDDYFVPREQTPRDENGDYDFEALEAIDIKLLNQHLLELFDGREVEIPIFDFKSGGRKPVGHTLKLDSRSLLLMEGIHGLNDGLTPQVEEDLKYRVYVSALTQLNLDDRNRIPTTDNRLLRRMVRDHQFRGHDALRTLGMWASVRRGEDKNIFPHQNNADSAFNSALDYELAVLKNYAEPLLRSVKPFHPEYAEAQRLTTFLNNFLGIPATQIPADSILREFIGGSNFHY